MYLRFFRPKGVWLFKFVNFELSNKIDISNRLHLINIAAYLGLFSSISCSDWFGEYIGEELSLALVGLSFLWLANDGDKKSGFDIFLTLLRTK